MSRSVIPLNVERLERQFDSTFAHAMDLIKRVATYIDGPGRMAAQSLSPAEKMVYAGESMRLTTALLEMASWLLAWRGFRERELSTFEVERRINKISLHEIMTLKVENVPHELLSLMRETMTLRQRVALFDTTAKECLIESGRAERKGSS